MDAVNPATQYRILWDGCGLPRQWVLLRLREEGVSERDFYAVVPEEYGLVFSQDLIDDINNHMRPYFLRYLRIGGLPNDTYLVTSGY
jgi:hypothetical protein